MKNLAKLYYAAILPFAIPLLFGILNLPLVRVVYEFTFRLAGCAFMLTVVWFGYLYVVCTRPGRQVVNWKGLLKFIASETNPAEFQQKLITEIKEMVRTDLADLASTILAIGRTHDNFNP